MTAIAAAFRQRDPYAVPGALRPIARPLGCGLRAPRCDRRRSVDRRPCAARHCHAFRSPCRRTAIAGQSADERARSSFLPADRRDAAALLLMGDLNEWRGRSGAIRVFDRRLGPSAAARTFPSWMPVLALDRIYADGPAVLRDVRSIALPSRASLPTICRWSATCHGLRETPGTRAAAAPRRRVRRSRNSRPRRASVS